MGERPNFIGLDAKPLDSSSRLALPSPRLQYHDGEIPPSLSPLDAFAAQSRMLAKQLDVKKVGEKRMSRLPPAMVTKSLSQHRADRPIVFRSLSEESGSSRMKDEDSPDCSLTIARPQDRPLSQHPRISEVPTTDGDDMDGNEGFTTPMDPPSTFENAAQPTIPSDYFGFLRTDSPVPTSAFTNHDTSIQPADVESNSSALPTLTGQQSYSRNDSTPQPDLAFAISAPIGSIPQHESSDDDYTNSTAGSSFSHPRKLSSSSGISAPHSPLSPFIPVHPPRSPSVNSEASAYALPARVLLNFSRPRSTASLSVVSRTESPSPYQLVESQNRLAPATVKNAPHIPAQADDADSTENDGYLSGSGPSYTYAKFSLPRGRMVSRDSIVFQALSTPHFEWEEPLFQKTPPSSVCCDPPAVSAPSQPRPILYQEPDRPEADGSTFAFGFRCARPTTPERCVQEQLTTSPSHSIKSATSAISTTSSRGRESPGTSDLKSIRAPPNQTAKAEDTKSTSSKSNSTLRARSSSAGMKNGTGHHYMSPDEHVAKGIECHENGSLQESTYHLRIAAMQNHPTGMLLYALACRHGWGMRPNQREGVQWLRKALDSAMLEVAEDEDSSPASAVRETQEKKARRAQFALSIYELGVSHQKGWGIEQDKALALRCFEVAGHWGDTDALTEAGFCYAEGVGCKKNMRKAAKFYRMAEQRGVSMVGNSW